MGRFSGKGDVGWEEEGRRETVWDRHFSLFRWEWSQASLCSRVSGEVQKRTWGFERMAKWLALSEDWRGRSRRRSVLMKLLLLFGVMVGVCARMRHPGQSN